jgi:hypothetical protein
MILRLYMLSVPPATGVIATWIGPWGHWRRLERHCPPATFTVALCFVMALFWPIVLLLCLIDGGGRS